jgi:O-antigen/teichoic acid export membrane protein
MSLKRNILANYVSQLYVTIIGIVMVPLYITYMGAEAYGLVGFFAMLQAWFALLDMGLTPTMARETARFNGGATDALSYLRLVRALEGVFLVIAMTGGLSLYVASNYIANDWLNASKLPVTEVRGSLELMAIIIALRWMCGLYRGAISGSERLVWLSGYNSAIATLRFVMVLPVLMYVGTSPTVFFKFQCIVAVLELAGLLFYAYNMLPAIPEGTRLPWQWAPLKPVLKFSITIAFTSSVWVLITQTDKLLLSKMLPLAEYGYFTLAVLVASGVMLISGPISNALLPRMSRLEAEGDHAGLICLYRNATQFVAVVAGAASFTVAFCAESLLWVWTGDRELAQQAAPILKLYALGNGVLAVAAFPYYLQYAKGDLRLHLIGNAVFVVLLIPAIIWAASQYGGVGAGWVWLGMNLMSFVVWLPLVHRKYAPGLNFKWYLEDIFAIYSPMIISCYVLNYWLQPKLDRLSQFVNIVMISILVMIIGVTASSFFRLNIKNWLAGNITKGNSNK